MKTLLVCMLATLTAATSVRSEDKLSGSFKIGIASQYLARVGTVLDTNPIMIGELSLGYGDWYGGVWSSTDLSGHHKYGSIYGDEIDVYLGWAHTFDWIKIDLSTTYYALAKLDHQSDDMWVFEPEVSFPKFWFVEPYLRARYFGEVGTLSPKGGMFYFAGIRKKVCVGKIRSRPCLMNFDVSTAYAGGALKDFTGFVYGRITASVDIPISENWTLSPSIIYQVATPGQRNNPQGFTNGNKLVEGISLSYRF